jgi:hypothetical protein
MSFRAATSSNVPREALGQAVHRGYHSDEKAFLEERFKGVYIEAW